jgi:hypothetical protein
MCDHDGERRWSVATGAEPGEILIEIAFEELARTPDPDRSRKDAGGNEPIDSAGRQIESARGSPDGDEPARGVGIDSLL